MHDRFRVIYIDDRAVRRDVVVPEAGTGEVGRVGRAESGRNYDEILLYFTEDVEMRMVEKIKRLV